MSDEPGRQLEFWPEWPRCAWCGAKMQRGWAFYCSARCRVAAWRHRRKRENSASYPREEVDVEPDVA